MVMLFPPDVVALVFGLVAVVQSLRHTFNGVKPAAGSDETIDQEWRIP
jgi:hypothetical protein